MKRLGRLLVATAFAGAGAGCAPRLTPLEGAPAPTVLPRVELPAGHQRVVFRWSLDDPDMSARGEGAARTAAPDSARLDFFLAGGVGSGGAVLIGTELRLPPRGDELARRVVPPMPLLWASLGRVVVPPAADTVARVDGDTLRADIGQPTAWRVTFVRGTLQRVERVADGRIVEWVERSGDAGGGWPTRMRYRNELSRRQLDLTVTAAGHASAFDPSIWNFN